MSDTGSSTRIVDLPDPNSGKLPQYNPQTTFSGYGGQGSSNGGDVYHASPPSMQGMNQGMPHNMNTGMPSQMGGSPNQMNGYVQMNVHPNPYGNMPPQSNLIPMPQQTSIPKPSGAGPSMNPFLGGGGGNPGANPGAGPEYTLPSRDIPMETTHYTQDDSIKANYIPPSTRGGLGLGEEDDDYLPKPAKGNREKHADGKKKKVRFSDDWIMDLRSPILIAMLYFLFQMPMLNVIMSKYLKVLRLFAEDGNLNYKGFVFKSILFGLGVYGIEMM